MKAIGIIAEYNPFHNGHLLHLTKTKKRLSLPTIAIMSGSFMQRGEPAFANKWLRAKMAIACGIDLVIELPTCFTLRSAEFFAQGGVQLLNATGIVEYLSCGVENSQVDYHSLAKLLLTTEMQEKIRNNIKLGRPYAKACELALGNSSVLASNPNNILALEYAKALLSTDIQQLLVERQGNNYNDTSLSNLASATAIRKAYYENKPWQQATTEEVTKIIQENALSCSCDYQKLWQILNYKLRISTLEEIEATTQCTEGLESLLAATVNATSFTEAVELCTTKRYSSSRIRRLLMQLLLNKPKHYYSQEAPAYLRVLAFNETGRNLLNEMKKKATLPIITKLGRNPYQGQSDVFCQQLELDIAATNISALFRPTPERFANDFLTSPFYKK
ncbi:MAG: nucleotidyltransferase family protein [Phascolarctobacterium sp.]|nr:nucleotidyltransferase family protein [Phascolarctobacterium sp.]